MKSGVIGSLKFKRLKRLLQLPDYAVCGVLESIWGLAVDQAKMGDIGRFSDDEIAAGIEWEGDATKLISALVDSRWLDRSPFENVRLAIHDWPDHAPQFVTRWIARRLGMTAGSADQLKAQWLAEVGLSSIDDYPKPDKGLAMASQNGVGDDPHGRGSSQTQSSQTKPIQTEAPPTPQGEPPQESKPKRKRVSDALAMALPPLAEFPEAIRSDKCRMVWQGWLAWKAKNKPYKTVDGHRKELAGAGAKGDSAFLGAIALALRKEWQGPNLRVYLEQLAEGKINPDGSENLEIFSGKRTNGPDYRNGPGQKFDPDAAAASGRSGVRGWGGKAVASGGG